MRINIFKSIAIAIAAVAILGISSCTLDEPENNYKASEMMLQKASSLGQTLIYITYDESNRPTKVSYPGAEMVFNLYYEGTGKLPVQIERLEYDEDNLSEKDVWNDIVWTSTGAISSLMATEYDRWSTDEDIEVFPINFSYDASGHLIEVINDGDREFTYEWENGLLVKSIEHENNAIQLYEYSNLANTAGVWSINWPIIDVLQVLGYYGAAPTKFMSRAVREESGEPTETMSFAYSVGEGGLINAEKVGVNDGSDNEVITVNYSYIKK